MFDLTRRAALTSGAAAVLSVGLGMRGAAAAQPLRLSYQRSSTLLTILKTNKVLEGKLRAARLRAELVPVQRRDLAP